jgi:DNA replicative helicase MCM subunit Mcm2 (Cdc46/Mcm family)
VSIRFPLVAIGLVTLFSHGSNTNSNLPHSKSSTGGNSNTAAAIAENAMRIATSGIGELDVPTMKKYIQYCKAKCMPRLSDEAGDILASSYVKIRDDVRKRVMEVSQMILVPTVLHADI